MLWQRWNITAIRVLLLLVGLHFYVLFGAYCEDLRSSQQRCWLPGLQSRSVAGFQSPSSPCILERARLLGAKHATEVGGHGCSRAQAWQAGQRTKNTKNAKSAPHQKMKRFIRVI
jgi:hypothetical protein